MVMLGDNTGEQETGDVFFKHVKRAAGDSLMTIETTNNCEKYCDRNR